MQIRHSADIIIYFYLLTLCQICFIYINTGLCGMLSDKQIACTRLSTFHFPFSRLDFHEGSIPLKAPLKRFPDGLDCELMDLHIGRRLDVIGHCVGDILSAQHAKVWNDLLDFLINDLCVDGSGTYALEVDRY